MTLKRKTLKRKRGRRRLHGGFLAERSSRARDPVPDPIPPNWYIASTPKGGWRQRVIIMVPENIGATEQGADLEEPQQFNLSIVENLYVTEPKTVKVEAKNLIELRQNISRKLGLIGPHMSHLTSYEVCNPNSDSIPYTKLSDIGEEDSVSVWPIGGVGREAAGGEAAGGEAAGGEAIDVYKMSVSQLKKELKDIGRAENIKLSTEGTQPELADRLTDYRANPVKWEQGGGYIKKKRSKKTKTKRSKKTKTKRSKKTKTKRSKKTKTKRSKKTKLV
jgi:hypothetical protein